MILPSQPATRQQWTTRFVSDLLVSVGQKHRERESACPGSASSYVPVLAQKRAMRPPSSSQVQQMNGTLSGRSYCIDLVTSIPTSRRQFLEKWNIQTAQLYHCRRCLPHTTTHSISITRHVPMMWLAMWVVDNGTDVVEPPTRSSWTPGRRPHTHRYPHTLTTLSTIFHFSGQPVKQNQQKIIICIHTYCQSEGGQCTCVNARLDRLITPVLHHKAQPK